MNFLKNTKLLHRAIAVFALFFVGACSIDLPGSAPPPRLYVLTPKSTFPDNLPAVNWQLLIEIPHSPAGINTQRIVLRDNPIELKYFDLANWTDLAPKMVQTLMVESFENSGKIVAVGREAIGLRADFLLKTELREFQAEYANAVPGAGQAIDEDAAPPIIRVRINAKLIKMPRRSIEASQTFERTVVAKSNTMSDILVAFDDGLGRVLKAIVVWSLNNGERATGKLKG